MDTSFDEIRQILKEISLSQQRTDVLLAKTDVLLAETIAQLAKTDAQLAKTDTQLAKTDAQLAKTDAQLAKSDAKAEALLAKREIENEKSAKEWKEIKRQLGDIGHSNGDAAENFFFNALEEKKKLGNIYFDEISRNVKQKKRRLEDEYDIFLENGNSVGVIEVKYKVKKDHVEQLINKKAQNFRILFTDYVDYNLYVGIAGLSFDPEAENLAIENGLVILKQKGDVVQINSNAMKAF